MRSTFAITSIVAAVFAAGMCAAWPAPPGDATKAIAQSAPSPVQTQSDSQRRWQAATTQLDMNAAASADESDARARMERALKEARDHASTLGAQASTVLALVDRSQRAWKAYFDAEVELRWPPNAEDFGTIYPMCVATDRARMCNERARALESLVHVEEGEVCGPRWDERKAEVGEPALTQPPAKSSK